MGSLKFEGIPQVESCEVGWWGLEDLHVAVACTVRGGSPEELGSRDEKREEDHFF